MAIFILILSNLENKLNGHSSGQGHLLIKFEEPKQYSDASLR